MEIKEIINKVLSIIRKYLPEQEWKIFLFGSHTKQTDRPTSDIDIAILGNVPVNSAKMLDIQEDVNHLPTLRSVDIVDLKKTSEQFQQQILKTAKLLS